jgi:hypothetical protein
MLYYNQVKGARPKGENDMIENVKNYIWLCERMLEQMREGRFHGYETERGTKWAIEFCKSLDHDVMTDRELDHAIRLTRFRGAVCPKFAA